MADANRPGYRFDAPVLRDRAFLVLVVAVSLAFAWILWPLAGAIFWGTIIAILFTPVNRRLRASLGGRRGVAALVTLAIVVIIVILPLLFVGALLVEEASGLYARARSGEIDLGKSLDRILDALPAWAVSLLARFDLTTRAAVEERLSSVLGRAAQLLAAQAIDIGQSTFDWVVSLFVMLYLLFFLLRDGAVLAARIRAAAPLAEAHQRALIERFTIVTRATLKGSLVVALVQGALGGLVFWLLGIRAPVLWSVVMTVLSLLPVVGAALVWFPVAVYLVLTGAVWQGVILVAYGVLVIGLVDNVLRPALVGKDTKMPDYLVLIATLGGIAIFGVNGFVIGPVIAALFLVTWDIVAASRTRLSEPERPTS